ncbi:hypothetical protein AI19_05815 [Thalassolituus oleivorans 4BN06-13]|nr:hypothetical protein [Thalassolituus oleivorans 4BN06-13]
MRISFGGFCFPLADKAVNRADWQGCQESIDQHRDVLPMRAKDCNEIRKQQGKQAARGLEGACPLRKEPAASAAIIKASLRQQIQATSYKSKRKAPHKPISKTKYFRQKTKQEGFLQ